MAAGKTIISLLRELMAECGPGPSRRREILRTAIETIESQEQQLNSWGDNISLLRQQVEMWKEVAEARSDEIYRLLNHHKRGET